MKSELVSILKCSSYEYEKIKKILQKSIDNLGGLSQFIHKGETVFLKVNMLSKHNPEAAVTTHPSIVRALTEMLMAHGAKVIIGDSPGGPFTVGALKAAYKQCGFFDVAEATGATLNYNTAIQTVKNPNGKVLKSLDIMAAITEADKVISLSKMKTHQMMTMTGAVKNLFGIVPGVKKAAYHMNMPSVAEFADCLVDICGVAAPILSIMDAVVAMEGAGPAAGDPIKMNAVLASASPYHLDVCAAYMMGIKAKDSPTVNSCIQRGLVAGDFSDIQMVGRDAQQFAKPFKVPKQRYLTISKNSVPKPIYSFVNRHIKHRPDFDYALCIGCQICAKNCPAHVIDMGNNKPVVDLDGCIRCYCCQELCPQKAVTVTSPPLNRFIFKW